jgi:hypothetical protein
MLRNTAHKCLNCNIGSIDICDIMVSYMNIKEYDEVVKEFKEYKDIVHRNIHICDPNHLYTVVPYILKLIRKGRMYKSMI